jgi:hypothetical protein
LAFGRRYRKSISTPTFNPRYAVDHALGYVGIVMSIPAIEIRYFLRLVFEVPDFSEY